jgi:hypothetical protein
MESESFYNSLLELLEDPLEAKQAKDLEAWWNRY